MPDQDISDFVRGVTHAQHVSAAERGTVQCGSTY
jgi:hypothetical protein